MKYPISIQTFEKIIKDNYVYVDKTDLVYDLVQEHVCFLSRPRRFGKSLLISTLDAYFQGKKELFEGLKIADLEKEWVEYPVFRIDFAVGNYSKEGELENILDKKISDWEKLYGKSEIANSLGLRFAYVITKAEEITGHKVVVLIDEYDKPLLDPLGEEQEIVNRNILRSIYGVFKATDAHLRFVLLTGVIKFSQITVFSGFNQAKDITMDRHYDSICGITTDELYTVFAEPIKELAEEMEYTEEEMKLELKRQYDGYHFSREMIDIYNPFSIINAFDQMVIDDYWYKSGTPTYLAKLIDGHNINMQKLLSQSYQTKYFMDYRADIEDPLAMFYQAGYLTIKGYNKKYRVYDLDYPNVEVRRGFSTLIYNGYFKNKENPDNWAVQYSMMLDNGDLDGIRDAYTSFLASIPYEANKDERAKDFETHFQYTFYIINRLLSCYMTLIEKQNSKGRADIIIEGDTDIYIFEFKLDGSADEALEQIEKCQYALPYLNDSRKIHKIGVNISSETRTVAEWKVIE